MMQQLSLGFGYVLLRITDLFNFLFNVKAINKFYDRISEKAWLKFECDTFDYGYYYAMYTTLMNITTTFGVQVPLLYFLMCVVLVFKLFGDGVKFTNIHGWDLEGSGKLFEVALRRLLIGATISHTLLVNQCFWGKLWRTMSVNAFMMVYSLVVYFLFKKKSIAKLSTILRILEKTATVFKKPTKHDLWNWKFRYNHPFLCNQDQAQLLQEMDVFQSNTSSNEAAVRGGAKKRRFNKPISIHSPSRPGSEDRQDKEEAPGPESQPASKFSSNRENQGQQPDLLARPQEQNFKSVRSEDSPESVPGSKVKPKLRISSQTQEGVPPAENTVARSSRFRKDGSMLDPQAFKFSESDIEEEGEDLEFSPQKAAQKIGLPRPARLELSRINEDEEEQIRESQVQLKQTDSSRSKNQAAVNPRGKEIECPAPVPKKKSVVPISMATRDPHEAEHLEKKPMFREDKDREKTQVSNSPLDLLRTKQNTQDEPSLSAIPAEPSRQVKSQITTHTNPPTKTAQNIDMREAGPDSSLEKIQPSEESPMKRFKQDS